MNIDGSLTILGFIAIIHIFVAILSTIELKDYPAQTFFKNILWFLIIWCFPFIGAVLFYKNISLSSGSDQNKNSGIDSFSGGNYGDGD